MYSNNNVIWEIDGVPRYEEWAVYSSRLYGVEFVENLLSPWIFHVSVPSARIRCRSNVGDHGKSYYVGLRMFGYLNDCISTLDYR
jgi:hypothetical protein